MELDKNKMKYFVIAIILLIILGVILIVHFNNKSMVSGDKDNNTTKKTTEKVTSEPTKKVVTTKKVTESEVSVNEEIYKSVVDENTKLLYNYKLTDEINETDIIISKTLDINEEFKNNNIIGLYDISLYDANLIKKSVKNSLITISIPIEGALKGYDDYKIVYIDNDNNITDEKFNTTISDGYINFDTTHLSIYGIIGIKNTKEEESEDINLDNVNVKIAFNNENVEDNNTIYSTLTDTVSIKVSGIDDYKLYYGLQDKDENMVYREYTSSTIFKDITAYSEFKLFVKVVIGKQYKIFELNTFKIYDYIYLYDKNNPEEPGYTSEETVNYLLKDVTVEDEEKKETNLDPEKDTIINIEGNIYVVEKADLSELQMKGTLYIDTKDRINLGTITKEEQELISSKELDKIVIMNGYFNLNGIDYKYSIDKEKNVTITRIEQDKETEVTENPFDTDVEIYPDDDENLVIEFIRDTSNTDEPEVNEPTSSEAEVNEPTSSEPEVNEPTSSEPEVNEPTSSEPEVNEPTSSEPQSSEPEANNLK